MVSGGYAGGATPVPIPNTEVKSSRADGTAGETLWESRTLPGFFLEGRSRSRAALRFGVPSMNRDLEVKVLSGPGRRDRSEPQLRKGDRPWERSGERNRGS